MSLTLRDAQYLSWKTLKKTKSKNNSTTETTSFLPTTVEALRKKADEIVETIKNPKISAKEVEDKSDLAKLLSEILFIEFILAEDHGINLEDAFLQTIDDYIMTNTC